MHAQLVPQVLGPSGTQLNRMSKNPSAGIETDFQLHVPAHGARVVVVGAAVVVVVVVEAQLSCD